MKDSGRIIKLVTLVLAIVGAVCLVVAFRDKLVDLYYSIMDKLEEKKCSCSGSDPEFEDYADAEM